MAQRVESFKVTAVAGGTVASPIETQLTFDPGNVTGVELLIPAGHGGLTGIALAIAHQIIVPETVGGWVVGDDDLISWPLDGYLNTGAWSAFAYNTDPVNDHSWYLRFLIDNIGANTVTVSTPVGVGAVMTAGGA